MTTNAQRLDVLCIGHASYDLVFAISHHPGPDEKTVADDLLGCGGGPAANAAVAVARLGASAGFCGYLGNDVYGDSHLRELLAAGVGTQWVVRGDSPTPLSAVLVKPNGQRALINYKGGTEALPAERLSFTGREAKVLLCDGHEPGLSLTALAAADDQTSSVLDGGSLHAGTLALLDKVDYAVCSEKMAVQYAGDEQAALVKFAELAPVAVITLGARGLIWRRGTETGALEAPPVLAVDSTGAGDAFHGAFAAGLAAGLEWQTLLRYASAAGALCCTRLGARPGLPTLEQQLALLAQWRQ